MSDTFNEYFVTLPSGDLNEHAVCKPTGYHLLICEAAEEDAAHAGDAISDTLGRGFAWAFTSLTVRVLRPVTTCRAIRAQTRVSPTARPYSRRELRLLDNDGGTLFDASLFLVPFDVGSKKIRYDIPLLDGEKYAVGEPCVPEAKHRHREPDGFEYVCDRTIAPSDLDALGHTNNCRYAAFAYDIMDAAERKLFCEPFEYFIDFRKQLRLNECVRLERCSDGDLLCFRGINSDGRTSFLSGFRPL